MDMFTGETLLEAMKRCDQYPDLEICIALKNLWDAQELTDAFNTEIRGKRLGEWRINRGFYRGKATIQSVLGSNIHMMNIQNPEFFRGQRFHWVLFAKDISEKDLEALAYMECLTPPWENAPESEALDDFLCSFKIV